MGDLSVNLILPQHGRTDIVWLLVCACLVMLMQAGFTCLEDGLVRAKNSVSIALKNIVDFLVSSAAYWIVGFAIMFGQSQAGLADSGGFFFAPGSDPWLAAFFLFQMVFAGTAATIISGAIAERVRFAGFIIITVLISTLIYPWFGHWAWAGSIGGTKGWLASLGFIDFAGATVVHSVGGWMALAAVIIIGPRTGRFSQDTPFPRAHNLPVSAVGVLLLWIGWLGFNGGSNFALDGTVPGILINTILAGTFGGLSSLVCVWWLRGFPEVPVILNGVLGGLVAITASVHAVSPPAAAAIGAGGGAVCYGAIRLLEYLKIDDVVGAFPVHGAAGIWGTLALALFADLAIIGTGLSRLEQLAVQAVGVLSCFAWSFGLGLVLLKLIDGRLPLRVSLDTERIGLNLGLHRVSSDTHALLAQMLDRGSRPLEQLVPLEVDPFSDVGELGAQYNYLLNEVNQARLRAEAKNQAQSEMLVKADVDNEEHRTRFAEILNNTSSVISIKDLEGRYLLINRRYEELFNISARDIKGQTDYDRFPAAMADAYRDNDRQVIAGGEILEFEELVPQEDGEHTYISVKSPILRSSGAIYAVCCISTDITERKRMADQLHENERALGTLLGNLPGMAYRCGNDSSWSMEFVSHGCHALTGYLAAELQGGTGIIYADLIHPEDREAVWSQVQEALGQDRPFELHYRIRTADDTEKWIWDQGVGIVSETGKVLALEGFVTDITPRKRAEEAQRKLEAQLQQGQRLEAVGTLSSGIAHDFNNILGVILAYTELTLLDETSGPVCENLNEILSASIRARDLIAQLLIFSRKSNRELKIVQVRPIAKEVLRFIRASIPSSIEIHQNLEVEAAVLADPTQIHQVIMNLCTNASSALGEQGGRLAVSLTRRRGDGRWNHEIGLDAGDFVVITVEDDGPGIRDEVRQRIFDPFFTTKERGEGTGLGLAVVHGIVTSYNGAIDVHSEVGHGTTFRVYLPEDRKTIQAITDDQSQPPEGKGRVLLVDDEQQLLSVGAKMLDVIGYSVTAFSDSMQAWDYFKRHPAAFDIVVTDQIMPRMSGSELGRRILELAPEMPIVIWSGYSDQISPSKAEQMGFRGFLNKPASIKELARTLQHALTHEGASPAKDTSEL